MVQLLRKLLILVSLVVASSLSGQYTLVYTDAANNPLQNDNVHACYEQSAINSARLIVVSNGADNSMVTLTLPTGISYEPGSVQTIAQLGGLSIAESNITNLSMPIFTISPANLSSADEITFSWMTTGDCDAVGYQMGGGIFKDIIELSGDAGTIVEDDINVNTYDLLVPSLSLFGQGPITTSLGNSVMREMTITNGGLGVLSELEFFIIDGTGTLTTQLETIGGTIIAPSSTSVDTLFYTLSGAFLAEFGNGNQIFENGEQVLLKRTYEVLSCDNDSYYSSSWGCGSVCMMTDLLMQQTNINNLVPDLSLTFPSPDRNYCYQGDNAFVGGVPVVQSFQLTNNGNGPATNFELTMHNATPGSGTGYNYYSTEPWEVKDANGVLLGTMTNPSIIGTRWNYSDGCVAALQPSSVKQEAGGIVIAPGETVFIEIPTYADNLDCWVNCQNANTPWWYFNAEFSYQDQCLINSYSRARFHLGTSSHNFMRYTTEMPTDLVDEECFNLEVTYSSLYTYVKSGTEGYNYLIIDLTGTGLSYNGGGTLPYANYNLATTVVGDSIRILLPSNLGGTGHQLDIPLCASCDAGGGALTVGLGHEVRYDEDCHPEPLAKYCSSRTFQMHCPDVCVRGGATPMSFSLERQTLGLEDLDNNGIPDSNATANSSDVKLHRALNGDTIKGTWEIYVHPNTVGPNADIPFNHLYIEFDTKEVNESCNAQAVRDAWFTPLPDAEVTVYPVGGGSSTCLVTPTITAGIAKYDLSICKSDWEGGDSIHVEALYVANAYYTKSGFYQYIADNEVYSSYIPDPTGANPSDENKYTCDHYNDYLNILNVYHSPYFPSPQNINGCSNNIRLTLRSYINIQSGDVWFPDEYRNILVYDKYVLNWPAQFPYRPGSATFHGIPIPDADVIQVGNQLSFCNLKQFYTTYGGTIVPPDESDSRSIYFKVDPTCEAEVGSLYNASFYGEHIGNDINIPGGNLVAHIGCSSSQSGNASLPYNGPLPFATGGGSVQATSDEACWDVILNNGSNSFDAPNTWFYIDNPSGNISGNSITVGNTSIVADANGFYQIGNNAAASSATYMVCAEVDACDTTEINILTGFHCSEYPSNTNNLTCADTVKVSAIPLHSEVQLALITEPESPLPLCVDQDVELLISSAQAAYLDNPTIEFLLPSGISLAGPVMIEYPLGSGNVEVANITQVGNLVTVNVEGHTLVTSAGLPGTIDALNSSERAANINFSIATDCDFVSGSGIAFQAFGERPCGGAAINNGVRIRSASLNVIGASQPYATDVNPVLAGAPNLEKCHGQLVTVDLQFVGIGSNMTTLNDTVYVTLDAGVDYVDGSFICCSADPSTCLTFASETIDAAGIRTVKFAFPSTPIDISSSILSCFSYEIANTYEVGCNLTRAMNIEAVTYVPSVSCPTDPSGSCPSLKLITGQDAIEFVTEKTEVSLVNDTYSCNANGDIAFSLEIQVDTFDLAVGETFIMDIFCANADGTQGAFVQSEVISGLIVNGNTTIVSGTIPNGACDPIYGIVSVLSGISDSGHEQCICEDLVFNSGALISPPVAPLLAVQDNVCPSDIGSFSVVTDCGADFHIEFSTDNGTSWMTTMPAWADGVIVIARCVSDVDGNCISIESDQVIASLQDCCPVDNCGGISIIRN